MAEKPLLPHCGCLSSLDDFAADYRAGFARHPGRRPNLQLLLRPRRLWWWLRVFPGQIWGSWRRDWRRSWSRFGSLSQFISSSVPTKASSCPTKGTRPGASLVGSRSWCVPAVVVRPWCVLACGCGAVMGSVKEKKVIGTKRVAPSSPMRKGSKYRMTVGFFCTRYGG